MPSGRPDWFGTIVAAGKYDSTYIPIALDVDGFITATMKGLYDSLLKTIAVDSGGIMKANLSAQDLDFLTVRPAYGATGVAGATVTIPDATTTRLTLVNGRGVLLGGETYWSGAAIRNGLLTYVRVDGVNVDVESPTSCKDLGRYPGAHWIIFLMRYDDDNFEYALGLMPGITFETSLELLASHTYGVNQDVGYICYYALVP